MVIIVAFLLVFMKIPLHLLKIVILAIIYEWLLSCYPLRVIGKAHQLFQAFADQKSNDGFLHSIFELFVLV